LRRSTNIFRRKNVCILGGKNVFEIKKKEDFIKFILEKRMKMKRKK